MSNKIKGGGATGDEVQEIFKVAKEKKSSLITKQQYNKIKKI